MIYVILFLACLAVTIHGSALRGAEIDTSDHKIEVWSGNDLVYEATPDHSVKHEPSVTGPGAIVQIGRKAWDFVKNNKAVVNYEDDWSGAVPQIYEDDWRSLHGWDDVKSDKFRFHYKIAGKTVSELSWRVSYFDF